MVVAGEDRIRGRYDQKLLRSKKLVAEQQNP